MGRRVTGSVRFDPYFKVQWWDERSLAWLDIQRAHDTLDAATAAAMAHGGTTRIMRVTPDGRGVVA